MDFESDLCFKNYTDNMAASKAPTNTINVSSTILSSSSTSTETANIIEHNFHELCRSCGKTNAELYDLFQTTNSPFSTSSTTCYTHLNNCSFTASISTSTPSSLCTTNKPSTSTAAAAGCTKSTTVPPTFDSMAATAKATAKGQSNMDNILQEMQIWQLMIKCNDGLPQRICAKCTAQFYMIHKFRRKCLKVQTQLRALYEEQQKFYERQQQQKEKNVTVKDATVEATSTPAPAPASSPVPVAAIAVAVPVPEPETALLVEVVKPPVMHKVNDLVNDNYCEPQQAVIDNTNTKSSVVSFEANTGNTNDFIAPSTTATTTLLDNVETMPQKTEANEQPTPTSSAPAFIDKTFEARIQEYCTVTTGLKLKDEKKPLLKPAVLDAKRSPPLTLQQPLEQICDNDTTADQTNASKELCLDQENFLSTHIIFKSISKQNHLKQCHTNDEELAEKDEAKTIHNTSPSSSSSNSSTVLPVLTKSNEIFKLRLYEQLKLPRDCGLSKANSENLFITKAALKAYTIPPSTTSETANRDHQKSITNSEAIELKNTNDNNNNAHRNIYAHRYDNRNELNDNTCSSTSNSTPSSSSSRKLKRTNTHRRKIIKYSYHNRRPGHCYKSNAKATAAGKTKKARTILSYGGGIVVKRKPRSQRDKHKLKHRCLPQTKTSSTGTKTIRRKQQLQKQKLKMCHKRSTQMEDEMSSSTVSTTSSTSSTSSSAISSTSSHLRATTPAATDLVRNCAEATSYSKNTNNNINKKGCSSVDRLSSNNSCIMWKTKAAMKANTNDMPLEVVVNNNGGEPTSNIPEISLPYIAPTTPTGSTTPPSSSSSSSLLSASLATETETEADKSSKTLYENQNIDSSNSLINNNNNLNDENCTSNKVIMSAPGNQVKDIKDKDVHLPKIKISKHNLWPDEAADQKQINTSNHNNQTDNEKNIVAFVKTNTQPIEFIQSDCRHEDVKLKKDEQEKPTTIDTSSPLPKVGSMKLIIQRKRGARFKCRRKYDDDDGETLDTQDTAATPKRRRKSSRNRDLQSKLEMIPFVSLDGDYFKDGEKPISSKYMLKDETNESKQFAESNSEEDENKENPIPIINNYEFDSDSNVSLYRDPLLIRNEMLEEDTHVADFSKTQLSIQTECSKEMYKLYKEKANLESPKKLIVRVPLTSLTQDFKRLHLTMDDQENEIEENPDDLNTQETNEETLSIEVTKEQQEELPNEQETSSLRANTSGSQSDFVGFSQTSDASSGTVVSSQPSIEAMRYIEPPLYSASSKINDFINDFQNNCIDSSEIEESCDMIPTLVPSIPQELSDEIRDVEDTLNGILSEMHDKDMYTPRSGETDELFARSVYSPLTDSPTTPSQSFYAESPCTINSNPMSVSPFIHHNMDYNAMTPLSNHSSMGLGGSYMSGGGSTGPHTSVYSEHYHTYNECFEESTQSELIGFQNDIPCFENIEMTNAANPNEVQAENNEEEEAVNAEENSNINSIMPSLNNNVEIEDATETEDYVDLSAYEDTPEQFVASQPTLAHADTLQGAPAATPDIQPQQIPYNPANYQPTFQMQNLASPLMSRTTTTQPHYIVTNTNQGSIIITNPQLNQRRGQIETAFKPHNNNLQFVTLGQAMDANQTQTNPLINNNTNKINWPTVNAVPNFNQQPVMSAANGTTTYIINANGELYQANIPTNSLQNRPVNTIFVPPNTSQTFNKTNIDNNDNYMPAMQQQQPQPQPQHTQQQNNGQSSQYIMLVNNLNASQQYYATTPTNINQQTVSPQQQQHNIPTPTVLFRPAEAQNVQNNTSYHKNLPSHSTIEASKVTHVPPIPTALELRTDATAAGQQQTAHQCKINQHLQTQMKQRQLHILQPRSQIIAQKITLMCRFCTKRPRFNNNVDYSNHIINTHPAEKPFNCPHCPMHFIRRSERQMHVSQFHGSRYECAQCGLSFAAQRDLDFHLQKYHANLGRSHQHVQLNSSSTTTTTTKTPATYQLLQQHNQQQRLVRVEDVHVQVTGENKNKRSIDLALYGDDGVDTKASQSLNEVDLLSHTVGTPQQQEQQQSRKLCCPDCNGDNDDCCGSNENHEQNDINSNTTETTTNNSQPYTGSESVNNHSLQQNQHVTIPSPEQTEPDSTTTLRHFRKRQIGEISTHFASASPSSSSSSSSSFHNNVGNNNGGNDNINLSDNSPDNVLTDDGGGGEQIAVERTLRGSHNCLLCEESFTNEIALRKHHHLAHGAATQSPTCSTAATSMSSLVCTICKRVFRMRNALQRHMETHDVEGRPYECNICQVRFPRPSQLTLHKLTVHKFEKPNSCEQCGKQFGTESAMKTHAAEHDEAATAINASASEASTSSSSQSQLSSSIYSEAIKTNTTPIAAPAANEQTINLQSTITAEDSATASALSNNNDEFNNATTQDAIVSELVT